MRSSNEVTADTAATELRAARLTTYRLPPHSCADPRATVSGANGIRTREDELCPRKMGDGDSMSQKGERTNPRAEAYSTETSQGLESSSRACESARASRTDASVASEFEVREPSPTPPTQPPPSSPPCENDRRKSSNSTRKSSSRHNSDNSRKSNSNYGTGSHSPSGVLRDASPASPFLRKGSSSIRNMNSRASSITGTVSGTTTARKCVGCAAGGDSFPVATTTPRLSRVSSDSVGGSTSEIAAVSPSAGPISYASSNAAAPSSADECVKTTALDKQHQQQRTLPQHEEGQEGAQFEQQKQQQWRQQQEQGETQNWRHQEPPEVQRHQQQEGEAQNWPHQEPSQRHQQTGGGPQRRQRQLLPVSPDEALQPHSQQPEQGSARQFQSPSLALRLDDFRDCVDSDVAEKQQSAVPISDTSLLHVERVYEDPLLKGHHLLLQQQPNKLTGYGNQPPHEVSQVQYQSMVQTQHVSLQRTQQDVDPLTQKPQVVQLQQHVQQFLQSLTHQVPCVEYQTSQFDKPNVDGGNCSSAQALESVGIDAAPLATQPRGTVISGSETEECRTATASTMTLGQMPGPAHSSHMLSVTRLAAASSPRHEPPPCAAAFSIRPRCSLSTSSACPEVSAAPILNHDSRSAMTQTGKDAYSPGAVVLRGAASAAAAAAAAATDAATLARSIISPQAFAGGTGSAVLSTAASGASALAVVASATDGKMQSATAPPDERNPLEPPRLQNKINAASPRAQVTRAEPEHNQQIDSNLSRANLVAPYKYFPETAEDVSVPADLDSLSRDHCVIRLSRSSNTNSCTDAHTEHVEHSQVLTGPCDSSWLKKTCATVEASAAVAGTTEISLMSSTLTPEALLRKAVTDTLSTAFPFAVQGSAHARYGADTVAAVRHHALPAMAGLKSSAGNPLEEAAAANTVARKTAPAGGDRTAICASGASVAAASANSTASPHQTYLADSLAATSPAGPTSPKHIWRARVAASATQKPELRRAHIGSAAAPRGILQSAGEEQVSSSREGQIAAAESHRHAAKQCSSALQPLQLPESPRRRSISAGGSPAPRTPTRGTELARSLSPNATPGTPQSRQQLQQLLLHRTPAPQDRPRRPAAAAAAGGTVVRSGGPVIMWRTGAGTTVATTPAAPNHAAAGTVEQTAVDSSSAPCGASAVSHVAGNVAGAVAVAGGEAAVAADSASAGDTLDDSKKQHTPGGRKDSESGVAPQDDCKKQDGTEELRGETTPQATTKHAAQPTPVPAGVLGHSGEQGHTDIKVSTEYVSDAPGHTAQMYLNATQQCLKHNMWQSQGTQTLQEACQGDSSLPLERQPELKANQQQHESEFEKKQTGQEHSSPTSQSPPPGTKAPKEQEQYSDMAKDQGIVVELHFQHSCEAMREGHHVLQRLHHAERETVKDEWDQPSRVTGSCAPNDNARVDLPPLPACDPCRSELTHTPPSVVCRATFSAAPSPQCSWSASTTEEDLAAVQVLDTHDNLHGELVYFNDGFDCEHDRNGNTNRRTKRRSAKPHCIDSERRRSKSSGNLVDATGTGWTGLCSMSTVSDNNGVDCTKNNWVDALHGSDTDLMYFPFSHEPDVLGLDNGIGGAQPAAAAEDAAGLGSEKTTGARHVETQCNVNTAGYTSANISYTATAAAPPFQTLPFQEYGEMRLREDTGIPAAVTRDRLDQQKNCNTATAQSLGCLTKEESDVEDNFPVSAAAMAAAAGAAYPQTPPTVASAEGVHTTTPTQANGYRPQSRGSQAWRGQCCLPGVLAAAAAGHACAPLIASARNARYQVPMSSYGANDSHLRETGDLVYSSEIQPNTEGISVSQLQGHPRQQRLLQPKNAQWLQEHSFSSLATATGDRGLDCTLRGQPSILKSRDRGGARSGLATSASPARGSAVASAASSVATATPLGPLVGNTNCPLWYPDAAAARVATGAPQHATEHLVSHQSNTRTAVEVEDDLASDNFDTAGQCKPQRLQKQSYLDNHQKHLSKATALPAAAALHGENSTPLPGISTQPATWTLTPEQHAFLPQGQQLLQASYGRAPIHLDGASVAFTPLSRNSITDALRGDDGVTDGHCIYLDAVAGRALPTTSLQRHTVVPPHQQTLMSQQLQQRQLKQLQMRQQSQQQAGRLRQPLSILSSCTVPSPRVTHKRAKTPEGDASPVLCDNSCGAALVNPPTGKHQPAGNADVIGTAVDGTDGLSSTPTDLSFLISPVKHAATGAAAAALAAATNNGAPTGIDTPAASSGAPAVVAAAASPALPGRRQEEGELFCPFRRTVETRRACCNGSLGAGGAEGREFEESAGEQSMQSGLINRNVTGLAKKRFLGGTTRLFGGVKTHAGFAAKKQTRAISGDSPVSLALSAPPQASQFEVGGRQEGRPLTRTRVTEASSAQQFSSTLMHQRPPSGPPQLQPHPLAEGIRQPHFAIQQPPQQPLSPASQRSSVSLQHTPRGTYPQQPTQQPYGATQVQRPFLAQQYSQFWVDERQQQQPPFYNGPQWMESKCLDPTVGVPHALLHQDQRPPGSLSPRADLLVARRGHSQSSTFLCETIPGSNKYVTMAPVGIGGRRCPSRSRRRTLPTLPCVAGRLLLAGGRVVSEVGQAAVDVGSSMVKEFASVLQRSLENIVDKGMNTSRFDEDEFNCQHYLRTRSNSFCVPMSCARSSCSERSSSCRRADPALGAGAMEYCLSLPRDEQLQQPFWQQQAPNGELQQSQLRAAREDVQQQQQEGEWRQRSSRTDSYLWPQLLEEHTNSDLVENRHRKEDSPLKAWGIATEERLGGLWLPKVDFQYTLTNQPGNNTDQQQASMQQSELHSNWSPENFRQHQEEEKARQDPGGHNQKQQDHRVMVSEVKYTEDAANTIRSPRCDLSINKNMSGADVSPGQGADQHQTSQQEGEHWQKADTMEREKETQKHKPGESGRIEELPAFPVSLVWGEGTPCTPTPRFEASSRQLTNPYAINSRKYMEQQEAGERLVRLAAPAARLRSSEKCNRPCMQQSSSRLNEPCSRCFSSWSDPHSQVVQPVRTFQRGPSGSSTTDRSNSSFSAQQARSVISSDGPGAAPSRSTSLTGSSPADSNRGSLFQTDKESLLEAREPRKGTSTFGHPEVMQQYANENSMLVCCSDDTSNGSTVNGCREDNRGLRGLSVETLSPRIRHAQKDSTGGVYSSSRRRDENRNRATPPKTRQQDARLEQEDKVRANEVCCDQKRLEGHEGMTHNRISDTLLHLHVRPPQQSCLSLQVHGIPLAEPPILRTCGKPLCPSSGGSLQIRSGSSFSMPYNATVEESAGLYAKLSASDRIVQRWKERAQKPQREVWP